MRLMTLFVTMGVDVEPMDGSGIGNPGLRRGGRGLKGPEETLLVPVEAGLSSRNAVYPKEWQQMVAYNG